VYILTLIPGTDGPKESFYFELKLVRDALKGQSHEKVGEIRE
jgi:hypothetical protein